MAEGSPVEVDYSSGRHRFLVEQVVALVVVEVVPGCTQVAVEGLIEHRQGLHMI